MQGMMKQTIDKEAAGKRYLTIRVEETGEQAAGRANIVLTVEQVLRKQAGLTRRQISRAKFYPDGIQKNGIRCRVTEKVCGGDIIRVCVEGENETSSHLESACGELDILYEDEDLLAVNKPAGMVTHPRGGHYQDTLANQAAAYFRRKGEEHSIRPVGRLDKETSGIVIFAKNKAAASRLQLQREQKILKKTYLAIVEGCLPVDGMEHLIREPMEQDPENRLKMVVAPGGKEAVTRYRVLKNCRGYSLVSVTLDTGRTHQIRVHMAGLGHPLMGDQLYNDKPDGATSSRAYLHAWKVELQQPYTGKNIRLQADVPKDMSPYIPSAEKSP